MNYLLVRLIKNKNLELIEEYLIKNDILNLHPKLSKYLIDKESINVLFFEK